MNNIQDNNENVETLSCVDQKSPITICSFCGGDLDDDSSTCPTCGAHINALKILCEPNHYDITSIKEDYLAGFLSLLSSSCLLLFLFYENNLIFCGGIVLNILGLFRSLLMRFKINKKKTLIINSLSFLMYLLVFILLSVGYIDKISIADLITYS